MISMNPEKVVARLQELYPGKNIVQILPEDHILIDGDKKS